MWPTTFLKRVYHKIAHTDFEVRIVEKKQSFKSLGNDAFLKTETEVVSGFSIEGPDLEPPVSFNGEPRKLGPKGNSMALVIPPSHVPLYLKGFCEIRSIHSRGRTYLIAEAVKNGEEVKRSIE